MRDAAYHHCPGIIRFNNQYVSIPRPTIVLNNQQNMRESKHISFCHHLVLIMFIFLEYATEQDQYEDNASIDWFSKSSTISETIYKYTNAEVATYIGSVRFSSL